MLLPQLLAPANLEFFSSKAKAFQKTNQIIMLNTKALAKYWTNMSKMLIKSQIAIVGKRNYDDLVIDDY